MPEYHMRRSEKAITDPQELVDVIRGQKYMTLALCSDGEPYLVTMNYGFDAEASCFYFHCAGEGKKLDILKKSPVVWGQVLEDCGYIVGKCDHAYRTVEFKGTVTFLEDRPAKRHALELMIDQLEPDPASVKARFSKEDAFDKVTIGQVTVAFMTGKKSLDA